MGARITNYQRQYIENNCHNLTVRELKKELSLNDCTVYKYLNLAGLKAIKKKVFTVDKPLVAKVLNEFSNNGYSIKSAALKCGVTYHMASWYIKHHYTRKRLTESTQLLTIQSAV